MDKKIIVGLDIGTTKIACFIGERRGEDQVRIIGFGKTESVGVERGIVLNIKDTGISIRKAVKQASEQAGVEVKEVYVGIAGQHIKSFQSQGSIMIPSSHREITEEDVEKLIEDQYRIMLGPGEEIIHIFPQSYIVDNEPLSTEVSPIGVAGKCLKANFHIVTGNTNNLNNIRYSVDNAGLKIKGVVLEPIASAYAVLDERDRDAGVALVDIGGGTTDIAIFSEGIIRHTSVLPLAGNAITEDIRKGCGILKSQAESLKTRFGSCLPSNVNEDDIISIPGIRKQPSREISMKTLAGIIHARTQVILEQVNYEIQLSGYDKMLIAGVVLTGGGAKMKHLRELSELITTINTRIGSPDEHMEEPEDPNDPTLPKYEELCHPMYSTGIGLVLYGMEQEMVSEELEEILEVEEIPEAENKAEEPQAAAPTLDPNDIFAQLSGMKTSEPTHSETPRLDPIPHPVQQPPVNEGKKDKTKKTKPGGGGFGQSLKRYFTRVFEDSIENDEEDL